MQGTSPFQDRLHEIAGILSEVSPYLEVLDFRRIPLVCRSWRQTWIPSLPRRLPKNVEEDTTVGEVLLSNGGRASEMWISLFLDQTKSLLAIDFSRLVPGDWMVLWGKYEAIGRKGQPGGHLELRTPWRGDFIPGEMQKKASASFSCVAATHSKLEEEVVALGIRRPVRGKFYLGFLFGPPREETHVLSELVTVTVDPTSSREPVLVVRREDQRTGLHPFGN